MKKGDDKWDGPYTILKVYKRSCLINLPLTMKIFPVFHNSLLRAYTSAKGLPGQNKINEAESQKTRGRVLERTDGIEEPTVKWHFWIAGNTLRTDYNTWSNGNTIDHHGNRL